MDKQQLVESLSHEASSQLASIEVHKEIDSTNSEALRKLKQGQKDGFLIVARSQSQGRGRRGRTWVSALDAGLYMSVMLPLPASIENLQALSLVTALAVYDGITLLYPGALQLKWPNDILVGNKKLAGILLERQPIESGSGIIFGIGVNIDIPAQVREKVDRPLIDLRSVADAEVDGARLCASIASQLVSHVGSFSGQGFGQFKERWNSLDRYLSEDIVIEMGNSKIIGKSQGVNNEGGLVLQTPDGNKVISSGEIFPSLRPFEQE